MSLITSPTSAWSSQKAGCWNDGGEASEPETASNMQVTSNRLDFCGARLKEATLFQWSSMILFACKWNAHTFLASVLQNE